MKSAKVTVSQTSPTKTGAFASVGSLFADYQFGDSGKFISQEFQDYGYRLAAELGDLQHKSLYIKLAKTIERGLLEQARRYVIDADHAHSKARLFMWKLKQLRADQGQAEQSGTDAHQATQTPAPHK